MTSTSWDYRATAYDRLQWVNDSVYYDILLEELRLTGAETVLDVGTGTGRIVECIRSHCAKVIGIDVSRKMLAIANRTLGFGTQRNVHLQQASVAHLPFIKECFDVIITRMVLHHLMENLHASLLECYRVLRKGGRIVIAEGVPPNYRLKNDFVEIFKWKERRHTFLEEDIMRIVADVGFHRINIRTFFLDGISINNWLADSALPDTNVAKILDLHRNASIYFKEAYQLKEVNGEVLIDMKQAIVTAEKY